MAQAKKLSDTAEPKAAPTETDAITNNTRGIKAVEAAFTTKTRPERRRNEYGDVVVVDVVVPLVYKFQPGETKEVPAGDLDHLFDENGKSRDFNFTKDQRQPVFTRKRSKK